MVAFWRVSRREREALVSQLEQAQAMVKQMERERDTAMQELFRRFSDEGKLNKEKSEFQAHLFRLGEYFFLDLVPQTPRVNIGAYKLPMSLSADGMPSQPHLVKVGDGLYARIVQTQQDSEATQASGACEIHLIQAHWVFRIWLDGHSLRLADLREEWFKDMAGHGRIHIGFDCIDDDLVLTASTEEVQAFLWQFGGNELAFPINSALEFHRQD
jgi:hypothetical protein